MTHDVQNYGLIAKIAKSLYKETRLYSYEDLLQIGLQSAVRLEQHFDAGKSCKSTFLTICVRRDIIRFIKKHTRLFGSSHAPIKTVTDDVPLWASLPRLDPEETVMVEMLEQGFSKREICRRFHLTKKQLQARLETIGAKILD